MFLCVLHIGRGYGSSYLDACLIDIQSEGPQSTGKNWLRLFLCSGGVLNHCLSGIEL